MATPFLFSSIYQEITHVAKYNSSQGYQEKFLSLCEAGIKASEFPNIDMTIEEFSTGGIFFNVEKSKMLCVSFKKSQFKNLGIYFRAQPFGNLVHFSLFKTCDVGLFDVLSGKGSGAVVAGIRSKCQTLNKWEEFRALSALGNLIFTGALRELDPHYENNRRLFEDKE